MQQKPGSTPLKNINVIVTRPKHQAKQLCSSLEILGARTILMPTMQIIGLTRKQALQAPTTGDIAIFTSANAVSHARDLLKNLRAGVTVVAIGPGTAKALIDQGKSSVLLPEAYSSEGVLALEELQPSHIHGKTVYVCTGANARPLLAKTLAERGAKVVPVITYERIPAAPAPDVLSTLMTPAPTIIVTTSKEGLLNLCNTLKTERLDWLWSQPLLVSHPSQLPLAKQLGFKEVVCAQNPTDDEIIQTLLQHQTIIRK